jgi:hypothetical protein
VALGCTAVAVLVVGAIVAFACFAIFLDSGADSGDLTLQSAAAFAPGSVTYVNERNFWVVRLRDGSFWALADLDQANRKSAVRRCRVQPVDQSNPSLPALLDKYGAKFSAEAAGATLLFSEQCNGAIYDVTGVRLNGDGPNLDRYPTSTNGEGLLVVNIAKRECSERRGADSFAELTCP